MRLITPVWLSYNTRKRGRPLVSGLNDNNRRNLLLTAPAVFDLPYAIRACNKTNTRTNSAEIVDRLCPQVWVCIGRATLVVDCIAWATYCILLQSNIHRTP